MTDSRAAVCLAFYTRAAEPALPQQSNNSINMKHHGRVTTLRPGGLEAGVGQSSTVCDSQTESFYLVD